MWWLTEWQLEMKHAIPQRLSQEKGTWHRNGSNYKVGFFYWRDQESFWLFFLFVPLFFSWDLRYNARWSHENRIAFQKISFDRPGQRQNQRKIKLWKLFKVFSGVLWGRVHWMQQRWKLIQKTFESIMMQVAVAIAMAVDVAMDVAVEVNIKKETVKRPKF